MWTVLMMVRAQMLARSTVQDQRGAIKVLKDTKSIFTTSL